MIRVEAPLETVPLFVRAGAILPTGPEMSYVGEKPTDPVRFEIYPDAQGQASTTLYEDDGITEDYRQGKFRRTTVSFRRNQIELGAPEGSFDPGRRDFVFSIHTSASRGAPEVRIPDDGRPHRIAAAAPHAGSGMRQNR